MPLAQFANLLEWKDLPLQTLVQIRVRTGLWTVSLPTDWSVAPKQRPINVTIIYE